MLSVSLLFKRRTTPGYDESVVVDPKVLEILEGLKAEIKSMATRNYGGSQIEGKYLQIKCVWMITKRSIM